MSTRQQGNGLARRLRAQRAFDRLTITDNHDDDATAADLFVDNDSRPHLDSVEGVIERKVAEFCARHKLSAAQLLALVCELPGDGDDDDWARAMELVAILESDGR